MIFFPPKKPAFTAPSTREAAAMRERGRRYFPRAVARRMRPRSSPGRPTMATQKRLSEPPPEGTMLGLYFMGTRAKSFQAFM